ncbi:MAG TPA: DUF5666 domain-containing protein [Candidatus Binatia bacterium]
MKIIAWKTRTVLVAALVALYGCESVALIGRPTIESRPTPRNINATVDGLDHGLREIYLRAGSSQHYVVNYTTDTRVMADGSVSGPRSLQVGDRVQVDVREGGDKRLYAQGIRIEKRGAAAPSGIRTVEGTVERLSAERGRLEVRAASGDLLTVYVPDSAGAEIRDRLHRLRVGDYVRIEGERLGEHHLELLAFR